MYIYIHTYIHIYKYISLIYTYIYTHTYIHIYIYIYIYIYAYIHTYIHAYLLIVEGTLVQVSIHIYTYIYIYILHSHIYFLKKVLFFQTSLSGLLSTIFTAMDDKNLTIFPHYPREYFLNN